MRCPPGSGTSVDRLGDELRHAVEPRRHERLGGRDALGASISRPTGSPGASVQVGSARQRASRSTGATIVAETDGAGASPRCAVSVHDVPFGASGTGIAIVVAGGRRSTSSGWVASIAVDLAADHERLRGIARERTITRCASPTARRELASSPDRDTRRATSRRAARSIANTCVDGRRNPALTLAEIRTSLDSCAGARNVASKNAREPTRWTSPTITGTSAGAPSIVTRHRRRRHRGGRVELDVGAVVDHDDRLVDVRHQRRDPPGTSTCR